MLPVLGGVSAVDRTRQLQRIKILKNGCVASTWWRVRGGQDRQNRLWLGMGCLQVIEYGGDDSK